MKGTEIFVYINFSERRTKQVKTRVHTKTFALSPAYFPQDPFVRDLNIQKSRQPISSPSCSPTGSLKPSENLFFSTTKAVLTLLPRITLVHMSINFIFYFQPQTQNRDGVSKSVVPLSPMELCPQLLVSVILHATGSSSISAVSSLHFYISQMNTWI